MKTKNEMSLDEFYIGGGYQRLTAKEIENLDNVSFFISSTKNKACKLALFDLV